MKKAFTILTLAAALLVCSKANAQLGVNAGYASQSIMTYYNDNLTDSAAMNGFFVGVNFNQELTGGLYVSVGLQGRMNMENKEWNGTLLGFSGDIRQEKRQYLVDVPVLLNYGFDLGSDLRMVIMAGPTLSYAVKGNTHTTITASGLGTSIQLYDGDDDWYEESDKYSQLDVAGTLGVCFTYGKYRLFGGYNMGLLNLSTADNTTRKAANLFFGIGMAL